MLAFVLLSFIFLIQVLQIAAGPVIVLPLSRVPRSTFNSIPLTGQAAPVNVTNVRDFAYLADIRVGGQSLPVIIDTGSYDLWVVSSNCSTQDCDGIPKYSNSYTLQETNTPLKISYLSGSVAGEVAFESISVGNYMVLQQVFVLGNDPQDVGLSAVGNSGIMGLAFPRVASIPLRFGQNFISNVLDSLDVDSRFFGVHLSRTSGNGTLTIGGHDSAALPNADSINLFDVYSSDGASYDYWKISLDSILVGHFSNPLKLSRSKVPKSSQPITVFDTGTTLILGPSDDVRRFWFAVGGARQLDDGTWQVRCEVAVELAFVFGDVTVFIDPADISWSDQRSPDGWCNGGMQANDKVIGGDWLLGDTFLRNVYLAHYVSVSNKPPKIGLLPLTNPNSSLDAFKQARGSLTSIPSTIATFSPASDNSEPPLWVAIVAPTLGFLVGFLAVAFWKLWKRRLRFLLQTMRGTMNG